MSNRTPATVIDFRYRKDLESVDVFFYEFRIGFSIDFYRTLEELKSRIPSRLRHFDERTKRWIVQETPATRLALRAIFYNFEDHLRAAKEAALEQEAQDE